MKKLSILVLALVLLLALAACGKKDENQNPTVPTTENSILPEMDPTIDTNVPDDNVNGNSTDTTNGSTTDSTGTTNGSDSGNGTSRNGMGSTGADGTMK